MSEDVWYTVTIPMTGLSEIFLSWDSSDTTTAYITNITWSKYPTAGEQGLVARNSAYLGTASQDELTAAGITNAVGTVYRFTKGVGSADPNNGEYGLWLENRDSYDFVTFDIRTSVSSSGSPYLLVMDKNLNHPYLTPGNSGITFVEKGTDTSVSTSDNAYNYTALNTWYTVTVPVTGLSEIYLSWDTSYTATVFITNIVWSD